MLLIAAAALLMQAVSPAASALPPAPFITPSTKAPVTEPKKMIADGDKVVCRSEIATGSMFGGPKECHTKYEWTAINANSRDNVNSFQQRAYQAYSPKN